MDLTTSHKKTILFGVPALHSCSNMSCLTTLTHIPHVSLDIYVCTQLEVQHVGLACTCVSPLMVL